jgi:multimeric flavodoxin WrbA
MCSARRSEPIEVVLVRTGSPDVTVDRDTFRARFRAGFEDPAFRALDDELARIEAVAWEAFDGGRKAPRTRRAGDEFADPDYELSVDWLAARAAIRHAQQQHDDAAAPSRILVVAGGARNEHTCPGELSKTSRLVERVVGAVRAAGAVADVLDLSLTTAEYGRTIYPCKACVSTAMPLCHWPCSCYPNHALGQTRDWMNEIYPMWVAAHGIVIVTPVYWYQAPAPLKLLIDRLVCADGGNPDPTRTGGKDAARAKAIELAGWPYPRHLEGRSVGVIVHGDAAGGETLRRNLTDWLREMALEPAGSFAVLDRYIGYLEPYATSHDALDRDDALWAEVDNVAATVVEHVRQRRAGAVPADRDLANPRPK